jgi:hypothetical protein
MRKTHRGSCHCGQVRFECELDLSEGSSRCNCSICTKQRFWKAIVKADDFRLLKGESALTEYLFGSNSIHHFFCSHCGIKTFGRAHEEELGDFVAINVACLDATPEELAKVPITYQDGRNNKWESPPAYTRYL